MWANRNIGGGVPATAAAGRVKADGTLNSVAGRSRLATSLRDALLAYRDGDDDDEQADQQPLRRGDACLVLRGFFRRHDDDRVALLLIRGDLRGVGFAQAVLLQLLLRESLRLSGAELLRHRHRRDSRERERKCGRSCKTFHKKAPLMSS